MITYEVDGDSSDERPLEIFHIEGRRSFRVIWLCEELAIPYTLSFTPGDIMGSLSTIRTTHPFMPIAPAIRYRGRILVESGAILEILATQQGQGRLLPAADSDNFLLHTQWMYFAEGTAMARMVSERFVAMALNVPIDSLPQGYRNDGTTSAEPIMVGSRAVFDYIEAYLWTSSYFGGSEFSAADIMMHFTIRCARLISWIDLDGFPAITRWRQDVEQRPAFARANQAATPGGADLHGQPIGVPLPFPALP